MASKKGLTSFVVEVFAQSDKLRGRYDCETIVENLTPLSNEETYAQEQIANFTKQEQALRYRLLRSFFGNGKYTPKNYYAFTTIQKMKAIVLLYKEMLFLRECLKRLCLKSPACSRAHFIGHGNLPFANLYSYG
jgi:hypothetical protein